MNQLVLIGVRIVDHVVCFDAQLGIAVLGLNDWISNGSIFIGKRDSQSLTNSLDIDGFIEGHIEGGATRKLNTVFESFRRQTSQASDDNNTTDNVEFLSVADEVRIDGCEPVFGRIRVEAERLLVFQSAKDDQSCQHNR